jgi:non-specific serine/threonine protein kinase/serine/threonine-protein kinase
MLTPTRHKNAAELFRKICQLPVDNQLKLLEENRSIDSETRAEVEGLLRADREPWTALSDGDLAIAVQLLGENRDNRRCDHEDELLPTTVGRYDILGLIGRGGMGTVFEASQDNPQRTVALKLVRPHVASGTSLRRFRRESHVLGRLRHPGIAHIYEAGVTDVTMPTGTVSSQPFIAMEYIRGQSLCDHVKHHNLNWQARLGLFVRICDAIQHAHDNDVIHRDLKPSNILIDGAGHPKIVDFGVAKLSDGSGSTMHTTQAQVVGTLPYMSPEQMAGESDLDFRSDIYALGVILFELLTGTLPHNLRNRNIVQALHIVQQDDPTSVGSINRAWRGDVDTIVSKALAKDRSHRYGRVVDLANDIRRYLADRPIFARPPSTIYQACKFAKRHRTLVSAVAIIVITLSAGLVGTSLGLVRARRAEHSARQAHREAIRQTRIAERVNDFLNTDLLAAVDPQRTSNPDLTVREALDAAALAIPGQFENEPLVEAAIQETLGTTYRNLGQYETSRAHLERAVLLRSRALGPDSATTINAENHLAMTYSRLGRHTQATRLHRRAMMMRRDILGPQHSDTLTSMNNLALSYQDQGLLDDAEPLLAQVYDTRLRILGREHAQTLCSMNNLASLYWEREEYIQALPLYEQALELRTRTLGPDDPATLRSMDNLATTYLYLERLPEAEALMAAALERARRVLDADHDFILTVLNNLPAVYYRQGKFERAHGLFAETVEAFRRALGDDHWKVGAGLSNQGHCLIAMKRHAEAEVILLDSYRILSGALSPDHNRTSIAAKKLSNIYVALDRPDEAARWRALARE